MPTFIDSNRGKAWRFQIAKKRWGERKNGFFFSHHQREEKNIFFKKTKKQLILFFLLFSFSSLSVDRHQLGLEDQRGSSGDLGRRAHGACFVLEFFFGGGAKKESVRVFPFFARKKTKF